MDGKSEVGNHPVERRNLRQVVLRITAYAEKLLAGLHDLDWPDSTKRQQKAWIGRSEGAEVQFEIDGSDEKLTVYTTAPIHYLERPTWWWLLNIHCLVNW